MAYKEDYSKMDGVWRTIGGRRVFIKKGQSLSEAMRESGKFDAKPKKTLEEKIKLRKELEMKYNEKKKEIEEETNREKKKILKEELKKIERDYNNAKYSEQEALMKQYQEKHKKEMNESEVSNYREEKAKLEKRVFEKIKTDQTINKEINALYENIEDEILEKKGISNLQIDEMVEEKIFGLKNYLPEEKEILFDDAVETISKRLKEKGFTYYGEGYNCSDIIHKTNSAIQDYLIEKNINYNLSRSTESGFFTSIYLENGERIGDHDNGLGGNVFKTRDLIEKWKEIVDELIKK